MMNGSVQALEAVSCGEGRATEKPTPKPKDGNENGTTTWLQK